jgi:hypothetical protein
MGASTVAGRIAYPTASGRAGRELTAGALLSPDWSRIVSFSGHIAIDPLKIIAQFALFVAPASRGRFPEFGRSETVCEAAVFVPIDFGRFPLF